MCFILLSCSVKNVMDARSTKRNETVVFRIKYIHVKGILSRNQPSKRRCSHDLLMLTLGDKFFVYKIVLRMLAEIHYRTINGRFWIHINNPLIPPHWQLAYKVYSWDFRNRHNLSNESQHQRPGLGLHTARLKGPIVSSPFILYSVALNTGQKAQPLLRLRKLFVLGLERRNGSTKRISVISKGHVL